MVCLACRGWSRSVICPHCEGRTSKGGIQRLADGLVVSSAFVHEDAPREIVHRLKFEGLLPAARWLAHHMAPLLDGLPGVLVPVPRTATRRLRYGVDPAPALAGALGALTGRPVELALRAPLWTRGHTGRKVGNRPSPWFVCVGTPGRVVLIDDVVTTGSTLRAAARVLRGTVVGAVTANRAVRVTSLSD